MLEQQEDSPVNRLLQWEMGQTPGPWEVILCPTNRCNQNCPMCWRHWIEAEVGPIDYSELSDERLLKLVDEAADMGAREWTITGAGEPWVRGPLTLKICERIRERGMAGRMNTNGVLLNRETLETLVRIGWDTVHFSVDGADVETYDRIRSKGGFERVKRNMLMLAELKRAAGTQYPEMFLNSVITNANYDKLDQLVRMAKETGCDKGMYVTNLVVHGKPTEVLALSPEQQAELPAMLRKAAAVANELGVPSNLHDAHLAGERAPLAPSPVGDTPFTRAVCFEAWLTLEVLPDGSVGPCCAFFDSRADRVTDKTLREAWLGPYMTWLRSALVSGRDLPHYCEACRTHMAPKTRIFREEMRMRRWDRWPVLPWRERARLVSARLGQNLRNHGVRGTLTRARQWARIHLR